MSDHAGEENEGAFRRYQRWEARNRRVVAPLIALVAMGIVAIIDPTNYKWYVGIMFVTITGYRAAAARESDESQQHDR